MSKGILNLFFMFDLHRPKSFVGPLDIRFWHDKRAEWFEDDFVRRIIREVDNAEVMPGEALKNGAGHGMSTTELSQVSKCLILMYFHPEYVYDNGPLTNKEWNYICDMIDLGMTLTIGIVHDFHPEDELPRAIPITLNGNPIKDYIEYEDYEDAFAEYKNKLYEEYY